MENFCLYNGKKIVKPETWDITSVELSSDYTSVIIQAESKINKSEYTLDIIPLIINQYEGGLDVYTSGVVNSLTGVSDWVLDPTNNQIKYKVPASDPNSPQNQYYWDSVYSAITKSATMQEAAQKMVNETCRLNKYANCSDPYDFTYVTPDRYSYKYDTYYSTDGSKTVRTQYANRYVNPAYDPTAEQEERSIPLETVAAQVISNAASGDTNAQNSIVSTFNNITYGILTSDYSEFFDQNKQPK